ncbi:MAG TPA: cation:proton antiporter [Acidimicrobiales bacterium]|nr:cation:proton antiporter [Acidimicrobiales bacterium]
MMPSLDGAQLTAFLAALAVVVVVARVGGEAARRLHQPEVLGELLGGVLLGPSLLGWVAPAVERFLFSGRGAGFALSGISFVGALLVLLAAGLEVDLPLLRHHLRPGVLAAAFAIVPSAAAGAAVGAGVLHLPVRSAAFLGIVVSVSAISVAAKLLIEGGNTRREFAQVILAGGIATELAAWILVSTAAGTRTGSPWMVAAQTLLVAVAFFCAAVVVGPRLVNRSMRAAADRAVVTGAPLSLVLVLTLAVSAVTEALGLHALLGAFVVGVLLSRSPRSNHLLADRLHALTVSLFGPVFFTLAGTHVDLRALGSVHALVAVAVLLVVATTVKVGFVTLGTRLGGVRGAQALLVGVGLNAKGGTDVVVAILGNQLHLLPSAAYTDYTVAAIVTVIATPGLMRALERRSPPSPAEQRRLQREVVASKAYSSSIERVLVPVLEELRPNLAIDVLEQLALSDERPGVTLDVTALQPGPGAAAGGSRQEVLAASVAASAVLDAEPNVEVTTARLGRHDDPIEGIVAAAGRYDLVAIGATAGPGAALFGPAADAVVHRSPTDVLVVHGPRRHLPWISMRRVLVPTNGTAAAEAAADLAGFLAQQSEAELVLLHVSPDVSTPAGRHRRAAASRAATGHVDDLAGVLDRFSVPVRTRLVTAAGPADAILDEVDRGGYDLVVMGATDRGSGDEPFLGHTVQAVVAAAALPTIVLVSGRRPDTLGADDGAAR